MSTDALKLRPIALDEDQAFDLRQLLAEAEAIQELASRSSGENEEDFEMMKNASRVTFRLLSRARNLIESEKAA
jgi:hypothetical protein